MKKLTSYLLLLVYLSVSLNFFLPVAAYKLNKNFIVDELCENKNKPEMNCDGKCYLGKQMDKQTGADSEPDNQVILSNIHELPHILLQTNNSPTNFPRVISYSTFYQITTDLITDVHTPPPKLV